MAQTPGPLLCAPSDKAQLEAENGVEQIDYIASLVADFHIADIRQSHILEFHRLAVKGIYPCAGNFRSALNHIKITGSEHKVPHESLVRGFVGDLCGWLNDRRGSCSSLERAAYALWRLNWIHPFPGGNGRSARALSYLVLSIDLGFVPPGVPQMPTRIYRRRNEYVDALRRADQSVLEDPNAAPDLDTMIDLIDDVMTQQLASVLDKLGRPIP